MKLDATDDGESQGEDESVEHGVNGLEHCDVLDKRAVQHDAENEGADEHDEDVSKKLGERVRLGLSLSNFLNHLLHINIFFYSEHI